jgi:pimeloyl-ACP methyl ester carboxylesterase
MSDDALSLVNSLGINPEHTLIVSHSMGGMVACRLASRHPFAGAVLLGPVNPSPGVSSAFAKRIETVEKRRSSLLVDEGYSLLKN